MTTDSEAISKDVALINKIEPVPTILDVIRRTTGMGFVAIARVTDEHWVACSVLDNIDFGLKPGGELQLETTICHEIRQSREPVVIDHVAEDKTFYNHHTPRKYGFQSYISMPIILADGRFFGTLCAIDPKPAHLNTPQVTGMFKLFAELIAHHIGAAEKLRQTESRLLAEQEVSELREVFIGVLGHDLRTPLNAVSLSAQMLLENGLNPEDLKMVNQIQDSVSNMADLINDTLDFARGRLGGGINLEVVPAASVEPIVNRVVEEARVVWPNREIVTLIELRSNFQFDGTRLAQLFTNLLANALTHGKPGTPVVVRAKSDHDKFEFSVSNASDPIPADLMQRLFEPFSRGGTSENKPGIGLGLYIASQIAKSHGGILSVSSTCEETRFTFTMSSGGKGAKGG
jgi:signal transduction histidine kinase